MKILLINPAWRKGEGNHVAWEARIAPASLTVVAALTPDDIEVSITDEVIEPIDFDGHRPDLVGITVKSHTARRAYQIAHQYRKRGVPVVLGGMHPTVMPEEAGLHADAIVVGEAESVWRTLLEDFRKGNMKREYRSSHFPDLKNLPLPRRDLLAKGKYLTGNTVHTTRGCPFNCDFCCVSRFYGRSYRSRPVEDVLREIDALEGGWILFTDDNIGGDLENAKTLFRELVPFKKKWVSQTSLSSVRDEGFLDLAARSGCAGLFVGFESLSDANLKEMRKTQNFPGRYEELVKRMHDRKVGVAGSFILGLDHDDTSVFNRTLDFAVKNRLEVIQVDALCPFPGTDLYAKLKSQKRLLVEKWWLTEPSEYYGIYFKPRLMSAAELRNGCMEISRKFYSFASILGRSWSLPNKSVSGWALYFMANLGYRRMLVQT